METKIATSETVETLPEISEILFTEQDIRNRIQELSEQIIADYAGKEPIAIAVLRGAAIFHADLIRSLSIGVTIDFISVSSYHSSTSSSGVVKILKNVESNLRGADVLIVEDIIDTGLTIDRIRREILDNQPASIRACSLLS